jgi:hypothetical protein
MGSGAGNAVEAFMPPAATRVELSSLSTQMAVTWVDRDTGTNIGGFVWTPTTAHRSYFVPQRAGGVILTASNTPPTTARPTVVSWYQGEG